MKAPAFGRNGTRGTDLKVPARPMATAVALDPESSHAVRLPNKRLYRPFSTNDLRSPHDAGLKITDITTSSDVSRLQCPPSISSSWSASSVADSTTSGSAKLSASPSCTASTWSRSSSRERDTQTTAADSSDAPPSLPVDEPSTTLSPVPEQPKQPASAVRKPAPGLAARLKALGFGSSKKNSQDPTPLCDNVGRLDEKQLRHLDEKHIAGSLSFAIPRRGRPWRGAGASRILKSSASQPNLKAAAVVQEHTPTLPAIESHSPLPMDTQKYRLPDHTNGNGTKVNIDTRNEHLSRQLFTEPTDTPADHPPPPPPKDYSSDTTPPTTSQSTDYVPGLSSYFTPGHNRPGSIYTLSRASFANQLAQLTSLQLPDAESLSSKVSAIPTATAATKALINAAEQIRSWISKAQEVIGGLDSEDDVEWAAAGGREGLTEVESAITRFEELINVYVGAIEELQQREDADSVPVDDLKQAVMLMDTILGEWSKIRSTLQSVRGQVELAMEWEEIWNKTLGDIQSEMDELSKLVFEMEERRHQHLAEAAENVDIGDLETIAEDSPSQLRISRLGIPAMPASPASHPAGSGLSQDDSSLLALFARMQPLRASLDFLPMKLSTFESKAERPFPTACEELEMRRAGLDGSYKKLEKDAESLRKELGEDRWVIVFRGAGRQAQKMQESVDRSLQKLREAIDTSLHLINPPAMLKKVESYEAKKQHYGPAIERVLSIIDRGVKDRLTVNGEILRLHADVQSRWSSLKEQMRRIDSVMEEIMAEGKGKQLRDSVSSLLSNDQSTTGSGHGTPGSSPPSSVVMASLGFDPHTPVVKARSPGAPPSSNRRHSSIPTPANNLAKRMSRLSTIASSSANTPVPPSAIARPASTLEHRPRWNTSTNTNDLQVDFPYRAPIMPSPQTHPKPTPTMARSAVATPSGSRLPTFRASRAPSESPMVEDTPSRRTNSRLGLRERLASPGPYAQPQFAQQPKLSNRSSMSALTSNRRVSMQSTPSKPLMPEAHHNRPSSSMATDRSRGSHLPQPRLHDASAGRSSPAPGSRLGSRLGMYKDLPSEPKDNKPRWRF